MQDELVWQEITQTVMSKSALGCVEAAAKRVGKPARVHLKVDTGMGRLGVPAAQAPDLIKAIEELDGVDLTGMETEHGPASDARTDPAVSQAVLDELRGQLDDDDDDDDDDGPSPFGG